MRRGLDPRGELAVRRRQRFRRGGVGVDRDLFGGGDGAGAGEDSEARSGRRAESRVGAASRELSPPSACARRASARPRPAPASAAPLQSPPSRAGTAERDAPSRPMSALSASTSLFCRAACAAAGARSALRRGLETLRVSRGASRGAMRVAVARARLTSAACCIRALATGSRWRLADALTTQCDARRVRRLRADACHEDLHSRCTRQLAHRDHHLPCLPRSACCGQPIDASGHVFRL